LEPSAAAAQPARASVAAATTAVVPRAMRVALVGRLCRGDRVLVTPR
jgi:hypothetical protein